MKDSLTVSIHVDDKGKRLDVFLSEHVQSLSRTSAREHIERGLVMVNGVVVRKPAARLNQAGNVKVDVDLPPSLTVAGEDVPLSIVYEDADVAVVDKPAGMVVHPSIGHEHRTLVHGLVARFPRLEAGTGEIRPGIVHRLDKDTSGLLVVALNQSAQLDVQRQISDRSAKREYVALVRGPIHPVEGTIEAPIGRDAANRLRMATHGLASRFARTHYSIQEVRGDYVLLDVRLDTGRTHQIRVHLAACGHPIVGDVLYGGEVHAGLERQFLHACRLSFRSPSSGQQLQFESPLPMDLQSVKAGLPAVYS